MYSKTEEFLNFLLWSANMLSRPTFRNLTDSYESWAYRQGLTRLVQRLEKRGLLEGDVNARQDRLYRLSAHGRRVTLGGREPEERWSRPWDGFWRLVIFDVPLLRNAQREELRRHLRRRGFGCLQQSVWVTPDRLDEEKRILGSGGINVKSLLLLEARLHGGESDAQIVRGAWDFELINGRYARYLEVLMERPAGAMQGEHAGKRMRNWAVRERQAWLEAVRYDPLLPDQLLPSGYLGRKSWGRRREVLGAAGQQIRAFDPNP